MRRWCLLVVLVLLASGAVMADTPCDSTEECENASTLACQELEEGGLTVSMLVYDQGTPECWFCCEGGTTCHHFVCFGPAFLPVIGECLFVPMVADACVARD